ncbi:hypothetical protein QWY85_08585 [Neolewinella lacunae]|uniref:Uncharacterized protein n=1 Tax=Neolewinella lacunae TaxID=1517758 RepID=A0A923PK49_9BACT|nr:hypothetical protein [Neolewinella lacunae]MBC6994040.1 hypothetical protein [Neolewinella lacunae]MDN3634711.1 hypothetical protein [Neolewinella lacunae]
MDLRIIYCTDFSHNDQCKTGSFFRGIPEEVAQVFELSLAHFSSNFGEITVSAGDQTSPCVASGDLVFLFADVTGARLAAGLCASIRQQGATVILGGPFFSRQGGEEDNGANALLIGSPSVLWEEVAGSYLAGMTLRKQYLAPAERSPFVVKTYSAATAATRVFRNHYGKFFTVQLTLDSRCYQSTASNKAGNISCRDPEDVERLLAAIPADIPLLFRGVDAYLQKWGEEVFFQLAEKTGHPWVAEGNAEICLRADLPRRLAKRGCHLLLLDIHSIDAAELHGRFGGSINLGGIEDFLRQCAMFDLRVFVRGSFGFERETPAVFQRAFAWMKQGGFERWMPQLWVPLPYTVEHSTLSSQGRLRKLPPEEYDGYHLVYQPAMGTAEEWERSLYDFHRKVNRYAFRKVIIEQNV